MCSVRGFRQTSHSVNGYNIDVLGIWWARQDLNLGPTDYESAALTAELQAPTNGSS